MGLNRARFNLGMTLILAGGIAMSVPPIRAYNHYSRDAIWKRQVALIESVQGISKDNKENMRRELHEYLKEAMDKNPPFTTTSDFYFIAKRDLLEKTFEGWVMTRPTHESVSLRVANNPAVRSAISKAQGWAHGLPLIGNYVSEPADGQPASPPKRRSSYEMKNSDLDAAFAYLRSTTPRSVWNECVNVQMSAFVNKYTLVGALSFLVGCGVCLATAMLAAFSRVRRAMAAVREGDAAAASGREA